MKIRAIGLVSILTNHSISRHPTKIATHRLAWSLSSCSRFKIFLGIERENLAAAAIQVVRCQEVRKDLQPTLCVFLGWLRENLDDVHSCQFEYVHPFFFISLISSS